MNGGSADQGETTIERESVEELVGEATSDEQLIACCSTGPERGPATDW
jgi:hypothetical protein